MPVGVARDDGAERDRAQEVVPALARRARREARLGERLGLHGDGLGVLDDANASRPRRRVEGRATCRSWR